mmetsp:Transcript_44230/g.117200  ORF Transcript_44230/g.117200 Transcript_44230/m.117200 type:complete len:289 (+) Transcript_44230:460-1326(+)
MQMAQSSTSSDTLATPSSGSLFNTLRRASPGSRPRCRIGIGFTLSWSEATLGRRDSWVDGVVAEEALLRVGLLLSESKRDRLAPDELHSESLEQTTTAEGTGNGQAAPPATDASVAGATVARDDLCSPVCAFARGPLALTTAKTALSTFKAACGHLQAGTRATAAALEELPRVSRRRLFAGEQSATRSPQPLNGLRGCTGVEPVEESSPRCEPKTTDCERGRLEPLALPFSARSMNNSNNSSSSYFVIQSSAALTVNIDNSVFLCMICSSRSSKVPSVIRRCTHTPRR